MWSKIKELGGVQLPNIQDWFTLPPKYEGVIGEIMRDSVQKYIIDNDPNIKIQMNESVHDARIAVMEARHLAEIRGVELEKKDMEIRAI